MNGNAKTYANQRQRNASPSSTILLKNALANRINPLFNNQFKLVNGKPPIAPPNPSSTNGQLNGHTQSSGDEMSTSILKNAAWYRDSDGRTGISLPTEWRNNKNIQQTEIKPRNSRSPTPERFVRRTASMETQIKPPQKYLNGKNMNGSPAVQPRTSSLFQRANGFTNGFGQRSNTDYGVPNGSMLKNGINGMERRGSSQSMQSVSSRGSNGPQKSVTFCDKVKKTFTIKKLSNVLYF